MIKKSPFSIIGHFIDLDDVLIVTDDDYLLIQTDDIVELKWNPESIIPQVPSNLYTVDIELYQLLSTGWDKVSSYQNQINNGNLNVSVATSSPFNEEEFVPVIYKIVANLNDIQTTNQRMKALNLTYSQSNFVSAGRWSHVIVWSGNGSTDYCTTWTDTNYIVINGEFEACPCSTTQAELPNSGFILNSSPGRRLMDRFLHGKDRVCYLQSSTVQLL